VQHVGWLHAPVGKTFVALPGAGSSILDEEAVALFGLQTDFARPKATWERVAKAAMLYAGSEDISLENEPAKFADEYLEHVFSPMFDTIEPRHFSQVEVPYGATSDWRMKKFYGLAKKRDVMRWGMHHVAEFWDNAHEENRETLWKLFGKTNEMLPLKKLENDDIRTICSPEVGVYWESAALLGAFDEQFERLRVGGMSVGFVIAYGGLVHALQESVDDDFLAMAGDIKKYDKDQRRKLVMRTAFKMRMRCHRATWMSREEFAKRLMYLYQQMLMAFVLLPWGQVVRIIRGMKSGWFGTSSDGSIVHIWVTAYVWACLVSYDLFQFERSMKYHIYTDDHFASVARDVALKFTYEARAAAYAQCGLQLKADGDVAPTADVTAIPFLGMRLAVWKGRFVPVPLDPMRLVHSLLYVPRVFKPEEELGRCISLMVLLTFTGHFENARKLALLKARKTRLTDGDDSFGFTKVPTFHQCAVFWLGLEGVAPPRA
jgi:hypothetical protein